MLSKGERMTNILIHVEGGKVQGVFSDTGDIAVTLIDYDDIERGQEDLIEFDNYPVTFTNIDKLQKIVDNANKEIEVNDKLLEE
jgi:hypothetical protein